MAEHNLKSLLSIENLSISFHNTAIIRNLNLTLYPNEIVALVGESGSGKSVTAHSITGLLPKNITQISEGSIFLEGEELLNLSMPEWQKIRGEKIGMIFQEPQSSLNPSQRCGKQVEEMGRQHGIAKNKTVSLKEMVLEAFEQVQLPQPERIYLAYPHQLSGGQKQRVMIAMALLCKPQLLIADEPTTALDVLVQKEIIDLIQIHQKKNAMSVLFISHDLNLVAHLADRIAVMKDGEIVEQNTTEELFKNPKHPYTQGLLNSRPPTQHRLKQLPTLKDYLNATLDHSLISEKERKEEHQKFYASAPLFKAEKVYKVYHETLGWWGKKRKTEALKGIDFSLYEGETLGLVGASGCGKSTLARCIVGLTPLDRGSFLYKNKKILFSDKNQLKILRKEIQFIFQDPFAALHPLKTIGDGIDEVLLVHSQLKNEQRKDRVNQLLNQVGLSENFYNRYPHELSGGQRQRAVIARALAVEPKILICDESVAALDISVQAQVLNLLNRLKKTLDLTLIFISHDLAVVKHMADRIIVMHKGKIVEEEEADTLYFSPKTPFTKALIKASVH